MYPPSGSTPSPKGMHPAVKLALGAVAAVLGVLVVISLARVGFAFWVYVDVSRWASSQLGLDYYGAELFATAATALACAALPAFVSYTLFGRHKLLGALLPVGVAAAAWLLVATVGADVYFDRRTGEALRYYADTPEGRFYSYTDGYEPRYGIKLRPYTREVALADAEAARKRAEKEAAERLRAEADARKRAEAEAKRTEAERQRLAKEEADRVEADRRREHERELERLRAEEGTRRAELEAQAEAARQQRAAEETRLAAEERAREEAERARIAEERRRQLEVEEQRRREAEERAAAEERRRRDEAEAAERRRREAREESIRKAIQWGVSHIP